MFENKTAKALIKSYETVWALNSSIALLGWDMETYMPEAAADERGLVIAKHSLLVQKYMTDVEIKNNLKALESEKLNDYERGLYRVLSKSVRVNERLPEEFVEEYEKHIAKSQVVWRNAKLKNDFKSFEPYLERIVEFNIKKAEYLQDSNKPYEALMDLYEEGLTQNEVDFMFSQIKNPLSSLIKDITNSKEYFAKSPIESESYSSDSIHNLDLELLKLLGFDFNSQRIDKSAHPFSTTISKSDTRITRRVNENGLLDNVSSVIHEFGHSLYEREIDKSLIYTPLDTGVSLGIHESQSRFWENIVGRSYSFMESNYSLFKMHLPFISKYSASDLYRCFNKVTPSFIRTESDELTYNMHIILRYEIERDLINRKISVDEIPEVWNEKMQTLLGITPKNDASGCLQDVHWSCGSFGYFPTYSIGTLFSAQIKHHLEKDLGSIDSLIKAADYSSIRTYLKEKIHKFGSVYNPKELVKRSFGESMNSDYFLKYAKDKYSKIYGLNI